MSGSGGSILIAQIWRRPVGLGLLGLAGSIALLAGCSDLFGPDVPEGTVVLSTLPVEYQRWWDITQTCSGLRGDLGDVEFRVLPGSATLPDGGATGTYYWNGNVIVLAESVARDGRVVRHEMLHALLRTVQIGGHPKQYFEARCGGLVSCGDRCSEDVGGIPAEASGAPLLAPDEVEVTVRILPSRVGSPPAESGCMTILVQARHVGAEAAVMDLGSQGFRWWVEGLGGGGGGTPTPPNDSVLMRPGASRYAAFDCPDPLAVLEPGEYWVEGEWDRVRSERRTLSVLWNS